MRQSDPQIRALMLDDASGIADFLAARMYVRVHAELAKRGVETTIAALDARLHAAVAPPAAKIPVSTL
jgi:hypothetical protein